MTAQAQAGRRGDGWISAEERLPEDGTECLICTPEGMLYVATHEDNGYWSECGDHVLVTHWMPLPDAPVADGQEESHDYEA